MKKKNDFQSLREQERKTRKNLIMDAAEKVFASKTFDKVNMRDIAAEVGFSPASIYTYFPDQETLFIETALRGVNRFKKRFEEIAGNQSLSVRETVLTYIEYIMDHYECLRMSQHCILYGKFRSQESLDKIFTTYRAFFDHLDRILREHVPEKEIRNYSHLLFAALNGILFSFGRYPGRTRDEAMNHMKKLGGLLADLFEKDYPGT